jgi:hypothetical protein
MVAVLEGDGNSHRQRGLDAKSLRGCELFDRLSEGSRSAAGLCWKRDIGFRVLKHHKKDIFEGHDALLRRRFWREVEILAS